MTNGPTKRSGSGLGTLAAAGMLVLAALVLGAHPVQAQDVAIKILVNDDPISDYDISQRERFLMLTAREQPGPELTKKATEMLVTERLQLQEGRKLGITPSEATSIASSMTWPQETISTPTVLRRRCNAPALTSVR
ncbi:MAG: hypothetical protein A49_26560 [Methyloceanibacter sp.]|nr:MAG: hypothetical protein A49_26560 [Methyloceanibacter sp.]